MAKLKILVTGASGYIGARLIGYLLSQGHSVRAAARSTESLNKRPWSRDSQVEIVVMDVLNLESVQKTCEGCDIVYYFIHSMNPEHKDFADADRHAAENMVKAAAAAKVERIIYLGGLGDRTQNLSHHLQSRAEVSDILHSGKVPVTTLRAAMIMGNGSVSFEILAYLARRLPIMITPLWVKTESQPIAIRNVINYLVGCLDKEEMAGGVYDIGGPDIINYQNLIRLYAKEAGLFQRIMIAVPILTPRLSSYWIHLVTPITSVLARPLTEGLRNRVVCMDFRICSLIPQELISCRQAIQLALNLEQKDGIVLPISGIKLPAVENVFPGDPSWAGAGLHTQIFAF